MAQVSRWIHRHMHQIHGFKKALLLFVLIVLVPACDMSKGMPSPEPAPPKPEMSMQSDLEVPDLEELEMPELKSAVFSYAVRRDGTPVPENEQPLVGRHLVTYT